MGYVYLGLAIIAEVLGTTALQACDGFTKVLPSSIVVIGYGLAFLFSQSRAENDPHGDCICNLGRNRDCPDWRCRGSFLQTNT